jgi:O-antigen ligase
LSQPPDDHSASPSQPDLWELREREKARYSRSANTPRKSSASSYGEGNPLELGSYVVSGLIGSVALLLLGDIPKIREDLRSLLTAAGSIIPFLLFAFARFSVDDFRVAVRRGPNPWIILLLAWSVFAFFISPFRQVSGFGIVGSDLVRVFSGAVLYLLAAYGLRSPKEVVNTAIGLVGLATLMALADLYSIGGSPKALEHSVRLNTIFGSHEGLGTLLMLSLPIPFAFVLSSETEEKRRLAALAVTLTLGLALLLARTRSAWIGTVVAFLVVLLFNYWNRKRSRTKATLQHKVGKLVSLLTSPATLLVIALIGVILFGGVASIIQSRTSIQAAVNDSGSRLDLWKAGARMTWDRPWTGWGLGSFIILQGRWSHIGDDVAAILMRGGDEYNNAHNYYIQWAADTGATGLILHVAVITAFLIVGIQGLWNLRGGARSDNFPPFQKTLLAGCVAAFAGGCVDAIASPAYTFHSLSAILWLLMGLGVAALRPITSGAGSLKKATVPVSAIPPMPFFVCAIPAIMGAAVAAFVLFFGYQQTVIGKRLPRGTFQINIVKRKLGPVVPGDRLLWRAVYHDDKGRIVNTYPGTIWEFSAADGLALEQMKRSLVFTPINEDRSWDSLLSVTAPSGTTQPIIAHAYFFDAYSRRYDAWSSISVSVPKAKKSPANAK